MLFRFIFCIQFLGPPIKGYPVLRHKRNGHGVYMFICAVVNKIPPRIRLFPFSGSKRSTPQVLTRVAILPLFKFQCSFQLYTGDPCYAEVFCVVLWGLCSVSFPPHPSIQWQFVPSLLFVVCINYSYHLVEIGGQPSCSKYTYVTKLLAKQERRFAWLPCLTFRSKMHDYHALP